MVFQSIYWNSINQLIFNTLYNVYGIRTELNYFQINTNQS